MLRCYHNSQQRECRNPAGAVCVGQEITFSLTVEDAPAGLSCSLRLWHPLDGEKLLPMKDTALSAGMQRFCVSAIVSDTADLCWYYFILQDGENRFYYGNNRQQLGGEGELYEGEPPAFQITVCQPVPVPSWYKDAIVYQIFPDRFARDDGWLERQKNAARKQDWKGPRRVIQQDWNDTPYYTRNAKGEVTRWPFFGGSLSGIRSKLFYLKSMGAGAIYLNPVFKAQSNHRYDTADYMEIDPALGTEEDFRTLAEDAGRLGIRLILDGVFNHTGADSIYFNKQGNYPVLGACQGEESPYYAWYKFTAFPDEYESWWGVMDLPDVDENNSAYRAFIYGNPDSVIRKWMKAGASGWRLDVADELPDDFIAGIRAAIKETDPDGLLMGEVWEDASNKVSYGVQRRYFLGDELDATMNYPVRELLLDYMLGKCPAEGAVRRIASLAENYPTENFYGALNLIGSHDRVRILTMLGDAPSGLSEVEKETYRLPADKLSLAQNRLKVLSLLQYALPGVPCLYYGDEAGAQGFSDPYNRGTYPWGNEDQELLAHYRMLALLRKQYSVLRDGAYRFSWQGEHVLVCERYDENAGEAVIAVVNRDIFGSADAMIQLPERTEYVLDLLSSEVLLPDGGVPGQDESGSEQYDLDKDEPSQGGSDASVLKDGVLSLTLPAVSARLLYCSRKRPASRKLSRSSGILCHVSSLPSGRLDRQAEAFTDYLEAAGQKLWQILPLNPADQMSGSPYASPCVFAGNPQLSDPGYHVDMSGYQAFCEKESYWLEDYALYVVLKAHFEGAPWQEWPQAERDRENLDWWRIHKKADLEKIKQEQFAFWRRWLQVKDYANGKGISIIGDIPVYVGVDSADTWAHREIFLLGTDGYPLAGAGVPPDYFSEDGQHWGNPLYDWDYLKAHGYEWWLMRISSAMEYYDYIRLDHFRSFSAFFAVPAGKTPRDGWWIPGAGKEFFSFLEERLGRLPFIAEDLGFLDAQVHNLIKLSGYPGMLVYQLSADEMENLSSAEAKRRVFYTGTHDNQTLAGWCKDSGVPKTPDEIIEKLYESEAAWVIIQLQDLLGIDDTGRMNVPGKAEGNWTWRAEAKELAAGKAEWLKKLSSKTGRHG